MKFGIVAAFTVGLFGLAGLILAEEQGRLVSPSQNTVTPAASLASTNKPQATESYPVIGHLEKRDRVITIKSGPRGPVYSVATKDGKVLFENLSSEQLRAQAPEIHDFIKGSVAGEATPGHRTADARVRSSALR